MEGNTKKPFQFLKYKNLAFLHCLVLNICTVLACKQYFVSVRYKDD